MKNKIRISFYYFYSLLWSFRYLPWRMALYIPILVHPNVRVKRLPKGAINFQVPLRRGMFVFGFDGTIGQSNCRSLIDISPGGQLIVADGIAMARGTRLVIGSRGLMTIGRNFWCNGDSYFNCTTKISIGDDNMYGWDVQFNTSDGHHVIENGIEKPMEGDITIGNHVWIASHCLVGKGSFVPDGCVVAQRSLVTKVFDKPNCLIGGMPAKILKEGYTWKE